MLQNINSAALLVASAAKQAGKATDDLKANIAWADTLIPALQQREKEMADGVHKIMSTVIEDITEFRRRSQTLLDGLTGNVLPEGGNYTFGLGSDPEEKPGEAEGKSPDPLALPAALDRRNTETQDNGE